MALFSKRSRRTSRRALRRAHTKTLKAQAQAEAAFHRSTAKKAGKEAARAEKKAARTVDKTGRAVREAATRTGAEQAGTQAVQSSRRARKKAAKVAKQNTPAAKMTGWIAAGRVLAPVLAPFAYRAAASARGQIDAARARRMGVAVEQLGEFSGHGATLSARIAALEPALEEMSRTHIDTDSAAYREATTARLAELNTAVHAAERMPTPRRKAAHRAVRVDLDRIDAELLDRLGVR